MTDLSCIGCLQFIQTAALPGEYNSAIYLILIVTENVVPVLLFDASSPGNWQIEFHAANDRINFISPESTNSMGYIIFFAADSVCVKSFVCLSCPLTTRPVDAGETHRYILTQCLTLYALQCGNGSASIVLYTVEILKFQPSRRFFDVYSWSDRGIASRWGVVKKTAVQYYMLEIYH